MPNFIIPAAMPQNPVFSLPGRLVWCGSMVRGADGCCHLYFSWWPVEHGFEAWVTHSQIGYAVAENPDAPYRFVRDILPGSGVAGSFDRDVTHNPAVVCFDGGHYLYYTGNHSDTGDWWDHRNHQAVGVAFAPEPGGKFVRSPRAAVEHPGAVAVANPSVCHDGQGRWLMVYKWVAMENPAPFYGPVRHAAAVADSPLGPFHVVADRLFEVEGVAFPGEDPFVFTHEGRLLCLLKDNATNYTGLEKALVLFESTDGGITWELRGAALDRRLGRGEGAREFFRMERPQLSFCNGETRLFVAVKPDGASDHAYSLNLPVRLDLP